MSCSLALYRPEWESQIRKFTLKDNQIKYVFSPNAALDFFQGESITRVVIVSKGEPVGFFILHHTKDVNKFTKNESAVFLRSFSINVMHQGKGYATTALKLLPKFVQENLDYINEVILTVHTSNEAAKHLYEKSGFIPIGITNENNKDSEIVMQYKF